MRRADVDYPHNFWANSKVFKDDESETEAKTHNEHRVCLLLVGGSFFACKKHAQGLLFAYYQT